MNYQPFYDMNILVSDPMLQALQEHKSYFIFMAVFTFYLLMFLHIVLLQLFAFFYLRRTMRQRRKNALPTT